MLVAKNTRNELVHLSLDEDRRALKQLRTQQRFSCPACDAPVQLKVGTKKIPHFAHQQHTSCYDAFSERESDIHLRGKAHLFELLTRFGQPQLEAYLPQIQQRPDILYDRVALEFQYSPLSQERFDERNKGYAHINVAPLWIPYQQVQRCGIQRLSIPYDQQKYIRHHTLLSYNPLIEQFIYYTDLISLSATTFITKVHTLPRHLQTWPFRQPHTVTFQEFQQYMTIWRAQRTNIIRQYMKYRRGIQDPLLKLLYEQRIALVDLPDYIGVPTDFAHEAQFPLDWQAIYYYTYYPHRLAHFLEHYTIPQTKVIAYDTFLKNLDMKKETQDALLYAQFVAIKRQN